MKNFQRTLEMVFNLSDIALPAGVTEKLYGLAKFMLAENEKYNLTAITVPDDIIVKHYLDSAAAAEYILPGSRVIDIGSGAGFPGILLALIREDLNITMIEGSVKKAAYIDLALRFLELPPARVRVIAGRAEELKKNKEYFMGYDIAVSRAVANLNKLAFMCLPFLRPGGELIAYKGPRGVAECKEFKKSIRAAGGNITRVVTYGISLVGIDKHAENFNRSLVFLERTVSTNSVDFIKNIKL